MRIIKDVTAIERIVTHCKDNGFKVATEDLTARPFQDNTLVLDNKTHKTTDHYTVYGRFGGENYIMHEGRLLEILSDLKLLNDDEILDYQTGDNLLGYRSSMIRVPWNRNPL